MRRGVPVLLGLLAGTLPGCSEGPARIVVDSPQSGNGGAPIVSVGFGGSAGEFGGAGASGEGGAGAGGSAGEQGGSYTAGVSQGGGSGGNAGGCSISNPGKLGSCEVDPNNGCTGCLCASASCASALENCLDDDRCERAAQCLAQDCPAEICASLAGAAQIKLLPVIDCLALSCAAPCAVSSQGGAAGQGGAGGKGGSAGKGGSVAGVAGQGGHGASGQGGQAGSSAASGSAGAGGAGAGGAGAGGASAGEGGNSGNGGNSGAGGSAGDAGAASGEAGAGGEAGGGGVGGVLIACKVPLVSPSSGMCVEPSPANNCNPLTGAPCEGDAGELCNFVLVGGVPAGFDCQQVTDPAALCAPCGAKIACEAGLTCYQGTCAKMCCDATDCGAGNLCTPVASGIGVCSSPP